MTVYFLRSSGAPVANAAWIDDVRRHKLCIANGAGNVHGIHYDLGAQFSLQLVRRAA
jgi:hypothetical protein